MRIYDASEVHEHARQASKIRTRDFFISLTLFRNKNNTFSDGVPFPVSVSFPFLGQSTIRLLLLIISVSEVFVLTDKPYP